MLRFHKIICSLLVVCLMLSVLPAQVFATEDTAETIAETISEDSGVAVEEISQESAESAETIAETTEATETQNSTETTECQHEYAGEITSPTCTQQGYTTWICFYCGDSYVNDYTTVLDHTYVDGSCSVCETEDPTYNAKWEGYTAISTKGDLNNIRNDLSGKYYLTNDIVFTDTDFEESGEFYNDGAGWIPIGLDSHTPFSGSLDGNSHTISGLKINYSGREYEEIGLFGYLTGTVSNLGMLGGSIQASSETVHYSIGSIVGTISHKGLVSACYSDCALASVYAYDVGGIAGTNHGTIRQCYFTGSAYTESLYAGGIAAYNSGLIENCYNAGTVLNASCVGGISGTNSGTIDRCYNVGEVKNANKYSGEKGGITGSNSGNITDGLYHESVSTGTGSGTDRAVKCTTEELGMKSTFSVFDFDGVWKLSEDSRYPFPVLQDIPHLYTKENTVEFAGGTGSYWDPYVIKTKTHFANIHNHLDAHYILVNNITFSDGDFQENGSYYNKGAGWEPIGDKDKPFSGSFDGNSFIISGLCITVDFDDDIYLGCFGYSTGTIKNLTVDYSKYSVTCTTTTQSSNYYYLYVGGIVGYGNAYNCHNKGDICFSYKTTTRGCRLYLGGISGSGSIYRCSNIGNLNVDVPKYNGSFHANFGGLAGESQIVEGCHNNGVLTSNISRSYWYSAPATNMGGITGIASQVSNSYNVGNLTNKAGNSDQRIGGISGVAADNSSFDNCYNSGNILSDEEGANVGGIFGYSYGNFSVKNSFNEGFVWGKNTGGILGYTAYEGSIENCYNAGFVTNGGSIFGSASSSVSLANCYSLEDSSVPNPDVKELTSKEMALQSSFVGFDFGSVWQIGKSSHYLWPELIDCPSVNPEKSVKSAAIILSSNEVEYHTVQPDVSVTFQDSTLAIGEDYFLQFITSERKWITEETGKRYVSGLGSAYVYVVGISEYQGVVVVPFEIVPFNIANAKLMTEYVNNSSSSFHLKDYQYDGTAKEQTGYRVCDDNDTISPEHYNVTYKDNIEIGTATMIITGIGDYYTGSLIKQFQINPRAISSIEVTKLPDKVKYNRCQEERILDVTGGQITIYYQDGGTETIDMQPEMLFDSTFSSVTGTQLVWIRYQNLSAYYEITVEADHKYTTTTTKPTYTKSGYTTYTCICGREYTDNYKSALGLPKPSVKVTTNSKSGKPVLSWKAIDEVAKYKIYRATSSKGTYKYICSTTDINFTDTEASTGKTYYYKVRAVGIDGSTSSYSSSKYAACKCATPVTKSSVSNATGKVKISWKKVSGVKKYYVYRISSSGKSTKLTTTTKTYYTDSSAKVGTAYSYKVKAVASKSSYNSGYSVPVKGMRICAQADLSVKITGSTGKPSLSWDKVSGAKAYNIYRADAKDGEYTLIKTTTSTSYKDKTAEVDKDYWYRVDVIGSKTGTDSKPEDSVKIHTTCAKPSVSVKLSKKKPKLTWEPVEGATKYYVYRATSKNGKYTKIATVKDATAYRDSKAKKGKTCYYKVKAIAANSKANSAYSSVDKIKSK